MASLELALIFHFKEITELFSEPASKKILNNTAANKTALKTTLRGNKCCGQNELIRERKMMGVTTNALSKITSNIETRGTVTTKKQLLNLMLPSKRDRVTKALYS